MRLLPTASSPDGLISARYAVITKTPGGGVLTTTSNVNVWGGGEERWFAVGALALGVAGGGGPIPVSPARHRHTGFCSHAQAQGMDRDGLQPLPCGQGGAGLLSTRIRSPRGPKAPWEIGEDGGDGGEWGESS